MRFEPLGLLSLLTLAAAHGTPASLKREAAAHNKFLETRSIKQCLNDNASGWHQSSIQRRSATLKQLQKRTLHSNNTKKKKKKRDIEEALRTDHKTKLEGVTPETSPDILFKDASCVLHPEATEGPYYIQGEYIRSNVAEDQPGIPFYIEMLIMDVNTCTPVPNAWIEFWNANATGVYAGVVAKNNGNTKDYSNVNKTFCRGVQQSDKDGVVMFQSIFPGDYDDRTTHVHIVAHTHNDDTVVYPNNTISWNSSISHVGQFFFDDKLRKMVDGVYPYNTNKVKRIRNKDDFFINETATGKTDPFLTYTFLGDGIEDGVMGWIVVGVDAGAVKDIDEAGYLTAEGGVFLGTKYDERGGLVGGYEPGQPDPWGETSPPYPPRKNGNLKEKNAGAGGGSTSASDASGTAASAEPSGVASSAIDIRTSYSSGLVIAAAAVIASLIL